MRLGNGCVDTTRHGPNFVEDDAGVGSQLTERVGELRYVVDVAADVAEMPSHLGEL